MYFSILNRLSGQGVDCKPDKGLYLIGEQENVMPFANPPTPHTVNNPIIGLTQSAIDDDFANEVRAEAFQYKLINGEGFFARGVSIDIDTVIEDTLKDECVLSELYELFTNDKMVNLMKSVTTLKEYFQDHMDESTGLLMAPAESGELE